MPEDWMKSLVTSTPDLKIQAPQQHVDPKQLQDMLQETFDKVGDRIATVEAVAMTQINLHKLVLRAFLDLDLVDGDRLESALQEIRDQQEHEVSKQLIEGLISSFSEYQSHGEDQKPILQLVPKPEKAPD
tara:strand:+ start:888 stop:1277 length:390 start_codon:yes stop_codon:yes gene_type:complete